MSRSEEDKPCILVAAGGTGGHIFPALSVVEVLTERYPPLRPVWLGSSHRMESRLIPARGIEFIGLRQTELRRKPTVGNVLYNLRSIWFLLLSVIRSIGIVRRLKPRLVLSTGGFAAGAAGIAAWLTRTPLVIIEPNAYPGLTNRWLGRHATLVFTAYPQARKYFPEDRTYTVGAPTRKDISRIDRDEARRMLGLHEDEILVLATGGSQGASTINRVLPGAMRIVYEKLPAVLLRTVHQCGYGKSGAVEVDAELLSDDRYQVLEFIEDMPRYMAAADAIISRAGASTLSEIACLGVPAILIPYSHSAENHQVKNARAWESAGAAYCIEESDLDAPSLAEKLIALLADPGRRRTMGDAARSFGDPSAAEKIADHLRSYLEA